MKTEAAARDGPLIAGNPRYSLPFHGLYLRLSWLRTNHFRFPRGYRGCGYSDVMRGKLGLSVCAKNE